MATKAVYTESQRAYAEVLLERSHAWTRATRKRDGLAFVIFPSSRRDDEDRPLGYYTTESGCTCRGFWYRGACSHQLAVKLEAEQAREAAARKPRTRLEQLEDAWLDEGTRTVAAF